MDMIHWAGTGWYACYDHGEEPPTVHWYKLHEQPGFRDIVSATEAAQDAELYDPTWVELKPEPSWLVQQEGGQP